MKNLSLENIYLNLTIFLIGGMCPSFLLCINILNNYGPTIVFFTLYVSFFTYAITFVLSILDKSKSMFYSNILALTITSIFHLLLLSTQL